MCVSVYKKGRDCGPPWRGPGRSFSRLKREREGEKKKESRKRRRKRGRLTPRSNNIKRVCISLSFSSTCTLTPYTTPFAPDFVLLLLYTSVLRVALALLAAIFVAFVIKYSFSRSITYTERSPKLFPIYTVLIGLDIRPL